MILRADARSIPLRNESVQCVVTSPPYFGLRNYQVRGQISLEKTPQEYISSVVAIFREVHRVLRKDGTCWINMGDCFNTGTNKGRSYSNTNNKDHGYWKQEHDDVRIAVPGFRPKNKLMMPARVAIALQDDGWNIRQEIIWHKTNTMPESCKDRPTTAHEFIFLLSKSARYYYDWKAISEKASDDTHARYARGRSNTHKWADGGPGNQTIAKSFEHMRRGKEGPNSRMHVAHDPAHANRNWKGERAAGVNPKCTPAGSGIKQNESFSAAVKDVVESRNSRSVWPMSIQGYPEAHFATFPEELAKRCILAGAPVGGIVFDPFVGSGTTVQVAQDLGRIGVGLDLKPEYLQMARKRTAQQGLRL